MGNDKSNLALLLLISILLSIYLYFRTYIISLDGAFQYIPFAKHFLSASLKEALSSSGQQPLYSLLIALLYQWVPDFETAGRLVASLFGILVIFPVYFLGRRIFDDKIAFWSTLLLTFHPYIRRSSADVLKESTYLFFLAFAIWMAWRTIQGEKKYPYLLIPFLSALAYFVRPDGIEVLFVLLFYLLFIKKFHRPSERWAGVLLLCLSSALLLLPYLLHLREAAGTWTLSRTKSIADFLGFGWVGGEVSIAYKIIFTLERLNSELVAVFHPLYLFLMVVGLAKKVSSPLREGEKLLISFFALHYLVLFLLLFNVTDWSDKEGPQSVFFSGRHVLPFLIFSIYWVGEGLAFIHGRLLQKVDTLNTAILPGSTRRRGILVWLILLSLALVIILPKTLKPQRYERLPEKWAGQWIKNQSGEGVSILTTLPRVAYYANGKLEPIHFGRDHLNRVEALLTTREFRYVVIRGREVMAFPEEIELLEKRFDRAIRFDQQGMHEVVVYQRAP
jgi:4-amino-4-deoxy-L-arabinose transferase-like glycosyltransferase